MKIVTYNVNGLRNRVSQFTSLRKLLDSLDADIICFQETKLSRHELTAELVRAEGYESFFSCTRTTEKGRIGYSGVATFCRVKSSFASEEVALPLAAEEGFTGALENSLGLEFRKSESLSREALQDFSIKELQKIDGEGRCVITDHGHFVLFNLYGPRAGCDDKERIQFKLNFFKILQRKWEYLLDQGRRIFVVGDLNIAPSAIDRCDAGPDFEKNEFRTWFRSLLVENGGHFFDVFREKHPNRREAYTCWATNSGAEEFNFGSRIDHILCAGPCLHEEEKNGHNLVTCHVGDCDILDQFKRWKPGNATRGKLGRNIKLEGSDHVPVYITLKEIPNIQEHNTPTLSSRYCPQVYGTQQTLVSMLKRKQPTEVSLSEGSSYATESAFKCCSQLMKITPQLYSTHSPALEHDGGTCAMKDISEDFCEASFSGAANAEVDSSKSYSSGKDTKKTKQTHLAQLSLKSFFQKTEAIRNSSFFGDEKKLNLLDISCSYRQSEEIPVENGQLDAELHPERESPIEEDNAQHLENEKNTSVALVEWQRIQQFMQSSIPLCKGHKEPCVSRVVKKPGPNIGRCFYVCARAEGPASNSEANCGFFKWAASKSKGK